MGGGMGDGENFGDEEGCGDWCTEASIADGAPRGKASDGSVEEPMQRPRYAARNLPSAVSPVSVGFWLRSP